MNRRIITTPQEYSMQISNNLRTLRKNRKMSLRALSEKSGVSYASLRRFEETGEISLKSLIKVAIVTDCTRGLDELFTETAIQSIDDLIKGFK